MKSVIFFLLINNFLFSQRKVENISFESFYKLSLNEIVKLKKINKNKFNIKNNWRIAELYEKMNIEDSAYANYYKIFEFQKKNYISLELYFETLLKLHKTESSKSKYLKDRRYFLNLLIHETKKVENDKWKAIIYLETANDYYLDSLKIDKAINYYSKALNTSYAQRELIFQSETFLNLGNLYTYTNEHEKAKQYLKSSIALSKKADDTLGIVYSHINFCAFYKKQKNYVTALKHIDSAFAIKQNDYLPKIYRILYGNQADIYEMTGEKEKLLKADKMYLKLDSIINDFEKNSNFYEIDTKYQLKEKNQQISNLNQKFNQNKILYLTLIFLVFLLALYSFIRWKKVDLNKKKISLEKDNLELEKENLELLKENLVLEKENLEIQHYQTLEQLEKVKQLVIEDHIILKNKAKIYLEDLIYIVADDHYLNFVTTHKKEFIRGKITEIIQELPPNFVKCHRSYIVNKNFIKSFLKTEVLMQNNDFVPVSRNFKF